MSDEVVDCGAEGDALVAALKMCLVAVDIYYANVPEARDQYHIVADAAIAAWEALR